MRSGSWTRANSSERSRLPRERLQPRVPCHDGPDGLETRGWRRSTRFRDFGIGGAPFLADIRILERLADVPAAAWDALHDSRNPFVAHAFLEGLERHHCIRGGWGWTPRHLTLWEGDDLVAAAPGYLKDNSHGEFVFDHAWAHAYARHGLDYFPKFLCAV